MSSVASTALAPRAGNPRGRWQSFSAAFALAAVAIWASLAAGTAGILTPWALDSGWAAWILDKKRAMLAGSPPPRIVIVAGSNALFGISAADLSARTSHQAINAAGHAAVGFRVIDHAILDELRTGDIALLPLESHLYASSSELTRMGVEAAHQTGSSLFRDLPITLKLQYLRYLSFTAIRATARQLLLRPGLPTYGYWAFPLTARGDIDTSGAAQDLDRVKAQAVPIVGWPRQPSAAFSAMLCESVRRLSGRGVRVIGTPDNVYFESAASIEDRRRMLESAAELFRSCGGEWLPVPADGVQPLSRMLDTLYHLTSEGRRARTRELADALCSHAIACPVYAEP